MRRSPRFWDYRETLARFDSVCHCGRKIAKGERIGYARGGKVQCCECWDRWCAENAEADMLERGSCY